ncbi:MAG: BCCT family transporter [Bdellovibrionota bacterium]
MPNRYRTSHNVGENNLRIFGMDIHHPVFAASASLIIIFVVMTLLFPTNAKLAFDSAKNFSINRFDWLFTISGNFFVVFCAVLVVLPFSKIRLGGCDAKPEFTTFSWLNMLFAAGMGIGLMFWSVAEPIGYYTNWSGTPLNVEAQTKGAEVLAMGATIFHWGLHPWAVYTVVALSLAFFTYNKKMPLTIRSGFYPILKDNSWGILGHVIDIIAVMATIFGLATSLGFGAKQAAGGLHYLYGFDNDIGTQLAIIVLVTSLATISVVRGLDGGVKVLSNLNIIFALLLLFFVIFAGPTMPIVKNISNSIIGYVENFIPLSNWIDRKDKAFYHGWTVFYWAWWISWSPFVGMFIARVSYGRTIREFIIAVMIIPTLVTTAWMGAFGGTALFQFKEKIGSIANGITSVELSLFQVLEQLPMAPFISLLSVILILCFFVTSSDSGSLVIDSITAGGKLDAPIPQRVFWAVMEGLIAIALLVGGGRDALGALRAAAISVGLPFSAILLLLCICLILGIWHEYRFNFSKKKKLCKSRAC